MNIRIVKFDNTIWCSIDDLGKYIGSTPYQLKWPQNTISVKKTLHEIDEYDEVEYIQVDEFVRWLDWAIEYEPDQKLDKLKQYLNDCATKYGMIDDSI